MYFKLKYCVVFLARLNRLLTIGLLGLLAAGNTHASQSVDPGLSLFGVNG